MNADTPNPNASEPAARVIAFRDLSEGAEQVHEYAITPAVFGAFLQAFDDRSPIHVDREAAVAAGFPEVVMHGAILNGFLSHFVGMILPGAGSTLLSVDLRYLQPSHLHDHLSLRATVAQRVETLRVVVLHVVFENLTRGTRAATGRVQVQVREVGTTDGSAA
jgi:3-hydroxybutyryl-CoA dehydratase